MNYSLLLLPLLLFSHTFYGMDNESVQVAPHKQLTAHNPDSQEAIKQIKGFLLLGCPPTLHAPQNGTPKKRDDQQLLATMSLTAAKPIALWKNRMADLAVPETQKEIGAEISNAK